MSKNSKPVKAKALTKAQLCKQLADQSGLTPKEIGGILTSLADLCTEQLKAVGGFTIPDLVKLTLLTKPATPEQKNVPNPFKKGEFMDRPAKPARNVVKARILKPLKDKAS